MGTKRFAIAKCRQMEEMKAEGLLHREIAEQVGLSKKQVDKYFERQNKKARMAQCGCAAKQTQKLRKDERTLEMRIKDLEREVTLLRSFLHAAGRM